MEKALHTEGNTEDIATQQTIKAIKAKHNPDSILEVIQRLETMLFYYEMAHGEMLTEQGKGVE